VFASSGCVYPLYLQTNPSEEIFLTEDMAGPPYEADGLYGWAKLMGELTLRSLYKEKELEGVLCRYFTVYGPRCVENQAIIAMMARAVIGQDPFVVWGTGGQVRNWTYISDIIEGTLLAAEKIDDMRAINLGTSERITVEEAARTILELAGMRTELEFQPWMPTGPANRVASFERAHGLLGWSPRIRFNQGARMTFEWYRQARRNIDLKQELDHLLLERGTPKPAVL
jgi:nucleoside-diphosphate-sugar epimerase